MGIQHAGLNRVGQGAVTVNDSDGAFGQGPGNVINAVVTVDEEPVCKIERLDGAFEYTVVSVDHNRPGWPFGQQADDDFGPDAGSITEGNADRFCVRVVVVMGHDRLEGFAGVVGQS